jgi:hypothetical protein
MWRVQQGAPAIGGELLMTIQVARRDEAPAPVSEDVGYNTNDFGQPMRGIVSALALALVMWGVLLGAILLVV